MQFDPARQAILRSVEGLAGSQGYDLEINGMSRGFPVDFTIDHLAVGDEQGDLDASLEHLEVAWNPFTLVDGPLHIKQLRIGDLSLHSLPAGEKTTDEPTQLALPQLPDTLLPVTLDELVVERIFVSEKIAGQDLELTARGSLNVDESAKDATLTFAAQRTDSRPASVQLDANVDLDAKTVLLDLEASEEGGLLASLAGLPEIGDGHLSIKGNGALADWQGQIDLTIDRTITAEGSLNIQMEEGVTATFSMQTLPGPVLASQVPDIRVPDVLLVDTSIALSSEQRLTIEHALLDFSHGTLALSGLVDQPADGIALNGRVSVPRLEDLFASEVPPVRGELSSRFSVEGYLSKPLAKADVSLTGLEAGTFRTGNLEFEGTVATRSSADGKVGLSDARLTLDMARPLITLDEERQLSWDALNGQMEVQATEDEEQLLVSKGRFLLDDHQLDVSGNMDIERGRGDAEISLTSGSLSEFNSIVPSLQEGRLTLGLKASGNADDLNTQWDISLSDLETSDQALSALIDGAADLTADISVQNQSLVEISQFELNGGRLTTKAKGLVDPSGETDTNLDVDARLEAGNGLVLPGDLKLQGLTQLNATITGKLDSPNGEAELVIDSLTAQGRNLSDVSMRVTAESLLPTLDLALAGDLRAENIPVELSMALSQADQVFDLTDIDINAPSNRISGNIRFDSATSLADGQLDADLQRLDVWQPLVGQKLGGLANLVIELSSADNQQDVDLSISAQNIEADAARISRISSALKIRDAIGSWSVEGPVEMTGLQFDQGRIDSFRLGLDGSAQGLSGRVRAEGDISGQLKLENAFEVSFDEDETRVRISSLNLTHPQWPLRLLAPTQISLGDGSIDLADTQLRALRAPLRARLSMSSDRLAGNLTLGKSPLSTFSAIADIPMEGDIDANVSLAGTAGNPDIAVNANLSGLRHEGLEKVPDGRLSIEGGYRNRQLQGRMLLSGLSEAPFQVTVNSPMRLSLEPFEFETSETDLRGRILGEFDLAVLNEWLTLDGQRVEGKLRSNLGMSGSLTEPQFSGSLKLTEGLVDLRDTGTRLTNAEISLVGQGQQLVVNAFDARTRNDGRLSGDGQFSLSASSGFPFALNVSLREANFVNTAIAKDSISGRVGVSGNTSAAAVDGELVVNKLEVQIPDAGGPDIVELSISESADETSTASVYPVSLNVDIRIPERMFVRGRGLESEWQGDLELTGSASSPRVVGTVEKKRGFIDALDNRFDIRRGILDFDGAVPPVPIIDIEAAAPADGFDAVVAVSGRATSPRLRFFGEPDIPEDEVLARLLFGRDIREISPAQAVRIAAAINKLRGGGGFDPLASLRDGLGIDTLDVGGSSVEDASVKAGKYLADGVFLEVERGITDRSGKARIEVELTPNITLESEVDENSNAGVGLNWRFDY